MKISTKLFCASLMVVCVSNANAQDATEPKMAENLIWVVGGSLPEGWEPTRATALVPFPDNPKVYAGTVYLDPEKDPKPGFKFLTYPEWGHAEYRAAPGATLQDGKIKIVHSDDDSYDSKIFVEEAGNYYIKVDLTDSRNMEATVVKSEYQDTPIINSSLFMVGTPTTGGYEIDNGTPMYQNINAPYTYTTRLTVKESGEVNVPGDFKITRVITRNSVTCWNSEFWYFADKEDPNKMVLNQEGDYQWNITEPGDYTITANTLDNTLKIDRTKMADNLIWIVGGSLPEGWKPNRATALVPFPDNPKLYAGTVYLDTQKEPNDPGFKFLTYPGWGHLEYRAAKDATLQDGKIKIVPSNVDNSDLKIIVKEAGNYYIKVDLENLEATVVKSEYQDTPIIDGSLFIVGTPTTGGYEVDDGTPMYQYVNTPYIYRTTLTVNDLGTVNIPGDFKITRVIPRNGTCWNSEYWYFADINDPNKMALNQAGDNKWKITKPGKYTITANTLDNTLKIEDGIITGVESIDYECQDAPEYYNLSGMKVSNPTQGLYIRKQGNKVEKIVIR